jgi:hypothetical protein
MATRPKASALNFEQIEMLANFSDYSAEYPKLPFEKVAQKLGVDFSTVKNGKLWEQECREAFDGNRLANRKRT